MRNCARISMVVIAVLAGGGVAVADNKPAAPAAASPAPAPAPAPAPTHPLPTSPNGDLVVGLCDGTTSAIVKGRKPGEALTPAEAKKVSDELMDQWKKKNPAVSASWDRENALAQNGPGVQPPQPSAASTAKGNLPATAQRAQDGHTYGAFTTRDEQIWRASTQAFVDQGNKIFHDAKAMGGTIAVSCDMCHPNGANTHPETYPKYQVQLGRVAMLRDMINWCIENPVRGKPLADDDPRLKAMEAYIYAQRKGVPLEYGKH
jgi:thiosulfate dehydrogenase